MHPPEQAVFPKWQRITTPQEELLAKISPCFVLGLLGPETKAATRPEQTWRAAVCDLFRSILPLHLPPRARNSLPTATATRGRWLQLNFDLSSSSQAITLRRLP
jgi:hypothetical protein